MANHSLTSTKNRSGRNFFLHMASPVGRLEVTSDGKYITGLFIENDGGLPCDGEPELTTAVLERAQEQLCDYFRGNRHDFDVPLRPTGTPFQEAIWNQLQRIRWGQHTSYKNLGEKIGKSGAARAVGRAVGANPIPIVIGCHRVLSATGQLTGYSGGAGTRTKAWLLDHENIRHDQ